MNKEMADNNCTQYVVKEDPWTLTKPLLERLDEVMMDGNAQISTSHDFSVDSSPNTQLLNHTSEMYKYDSLIGPSTISLECYLSDIPHLSEGISSDANIRMVQEEEIHKEVQTDQSMQTKDVD